MRPKKMCLTVIIVTLSFLAVQPLALAATQSFSINGRGQGHGVGLDLASSRGLADAGHGYQDIIGRFYSSVDFSVTDDAQRMRIGMYGTNGSITVATPGTLTVKDTVGNVVWTGSANQWLAVSHVAGTYNYSTSTGTNGSSLTPLRFYPSNPPQVQILNLSYPNTFRGSVEVKYSDFSDQLWAINELTLREYLFGLADVPDSWPTEAMKTVAVASRTLALQKKSDPLNTRKNDGFDITATTDGPVYLGYDYEMAAPRFKAAVDATKNQIMTHNSEPIRALYHANSGGHTEDYENVFGGSTFPYLVGVPSEKYEWSANSSWSLHYSASELERRLKADSRTGFSGDLEGFRIVKTGVSPRVMELEILSSRSTRPVKGLDFQATLGLKSQWYRFRTINRLFGSNRYATAADISAYRWGSANTVVLASGADFADALAGVPLAVHMKAPILLTDPKTLSPETASELQRLQAENVIILGGEGAVSAIVSSEVESKNIKVQRIAGVDRYWTAYAIAKSLNPSGNVAAVATGENFPDSLSISSHAAGNNIPILFARKDDATSATRQAIQELGINSTIVVGGEGVISPAALSQLPDAVRVGGTDRYDTARLVANRYFGVSSPATSVFVATGDDFPDALVGGNLAAAFGPSPILLSKPLAVPAPTRDYLVNYGSRITVDYLLGGAGVLSVDVEKAIGSF